MEKIIDPFEDASPLLAKMLAGFDTTELLGFISSNVPSHWAIMSPLGEEIITKAFEIWKDEDASDEVA